MAPYTPPIERDLIKLRGKLEKMTKLLIYQVNELKGCFEQFDEARLDQIVERDRKLDSLELRINDLCMQFIEYHAPLALDLRQVVLALGLSANLERAGDCIEYTARHIKRNKSLQEDIPNSWDKLQAMVNLAGDMFSKALHSWRHMDLELARSIPCIDKNMNQIRAELYELALEAMRHKGVDPAQGVDLILIANKLEGIGDIAAHIGKSLVFMISAQRIRHSQQLTKTP